MYHFYNHSLHGQQVASPKSKCIKNKRQGKKILHAFCFMAKSMFDGTVKDGSQKYFFLMHLCIIGI